MMGLERSHFFQTNTVCNGSFKDACFFCQNRFLFKGMFFFACVSQMRFPKLGMQWEFGWQHSGKKLEVQKYQWFVVVVVVRHEWNYVKKAPPNDALDSQDSESPYHAADLARGVVQLGQDLRVVLVAAAFFFDQHGNGKYWNITIFK